MGNTNLTDMTLLPGVEPMAEVAASSSPAKETKIKKKTMKSLYL
uniref:Uncharacterized protein n=1 Tax=Arundo donax TaxID=35708 RepID=A0A0A9C151_ARUDO